VFISIVDRALETFLQERVQSPGGPVTVSFDAPTPEWVAQRSGPPTVNLFLHRVDRSNLLVRAPQRRFDANGRPDRRVPNLQMIDLAFVVTVWADHAAAEHELLSQVVSLLAATPALPATAVPPGLSSPVSLTFGASESGPATAPFTTTGPLKAYALFTAAVATDLDRQEDTAVAQG
jgi:hypothetical protein